MTYNIPVPPGSEGTRLDVFLMDFVKANGLGISRTYLKELIDSGRVCLKEGGPVSAHLKVRAGQEIVLDLVLKESLPLQPEDIPLDILYEDDHVAVVYKPAGLVAHPAPGNPSHTLVNALLFRINKLSSVNPGRPGIVHRLDKETSGILVVAKDNVSHLGLARQFEEHSITRRYIALVKGRVEFNEDVIEAPLGRDDQRRENIKVDFSPGSRYARTRYRVLGRGADFSWLELEPFTGRTHQLRVHMAYIGHPILGDPKYGRQNPFPRMALHAKTLGFTHPVTRKYLEFTTGDPAEFTAFLEKNPVDGSLPRRSRRKGG